ncbi:MAG: hypothetical protein ACRC1H_16140 [Caldilineaceae bacterium]
MGIAAESGRNMPAARVKRLEVLAGTISAVVQDRDAGACTVDVRVATLRPEQWERVGEQLSNLAMVNAQILSGAMPPEIEQVFTEAGSSLLPQKGEVTTLCSCCSPGACRHLPLIFTLFAEMLTDDPGLLFTLRGRDRQQILRDVREARATPPGAGNLASAAAQPSSAESGDAVAEARPGGPPQTGAHLFGGSHTHGAGAHTASASASASQGEATEGSGLAAQMEQYWGNRKLLKQFHHHIAPPLVELSLLRRLGPINTSDDAMALYEQMVAIYRRITEDALALAYATDDDATPANGAGDRI